MVSRYQNGPVKPEGMCLLPQPFRMMPPRNDILVTPPGYAQTPGNQGGNQGPGIRGIAPSGPPNQASTPPNAELKVPQLQQQPALNHMYMRPTPQGTYYQARSNPPPTQNPRMPNNNHRPPQPVYSPPTQYMLPTQTFIMSNPVTYYNPQQRPPSFVPPALPMYSTGPPLAAYQFNPNPSQSQVPYFYNPSPMIQQRGTSISQSQSTNPNPTQAAVPTGPPIVKAQAPMQRYKVTQNKRRPNAIAIIDPNTGEDKSAELYDGEIPSRPASGESSTCQTPQPNASHTHKQEVQATFAKMVFQALQEDVVTRATPEEERIQRHHFAETCPAPAYPAQQQATLPPPEQQQQPPAQQNTQKIENIVQSSKLQALAKEFVLPNTAKEPPVVSANCDAVEVTLPNKLPKDRESPVKRSKPREQPPVPAPREHKDSLKESSTKETIVSDKPASIVKEPEVKPKEVSSSNTTNVSQLPPAVKETVKENNHQNQDKRGQRKDVKPETVKAPSIEPSEAAPTSPVQPLQPTHDVNCNAKPKPNVQKSNAKLSTPQPQQHQSQAQNSNTKPASIPVPQPQPPKPSNKSHKKNEINQKGANKEGTDMDAFNDNLTPKEEVNANLTSNTVNDIINANTIPLVNNVTAPVKDINVNIESNKTLDSNDLTIKSEPPKTVKPKIDITDIVKEVPKPLKLNIESHDEIDRASIPNDKLVQAKNEANAKSNDTAADKLPYKDGQWTPNNTSGCKVYQKDFLIALKDAPSSRMRPDNIPDVVLADDRGRLPDGRHSMGGRSDMTNPPFNNFGGSKSGSQRAGVTQRNSKTKMIDPKRKGPSMKVSISVREDVKLHESENAWRPARYAKGETATEDDKKTEDLYRKVRGVLNKLTPQKFNTLLSQIKALQIDTASRLQGVIDLVFEKAVDEPNFSVAYASMCAELALMQVPAQNSTPEKPEVVNFRKLLINRCQVEFEKQSHDESVRKSKVKEINECSDQEKKKDLEFELEEYDRRLRMKSVGNIRFIGELFKQNMLTVNIMMKCLKNLLDNKDEESLECLCKLLTTIGKELESKHVDLSQILSAMKSLAEKRDGKVSSRIRFMLKDVIDLKNSKWIPRRQDHNPKTIDQIQKEADQEQMNIQMMHSAPMPSRRDDRVGNMGGSQNTLDRKGGRGSRNNASDSDGWIASNSRNRPSPFTVQSDKLKSKAPLIDEPLGNSQMFGSWGKGSVGSSVKSQPQMGLNTTNMYAALENIEPERRNLGGQRPGSKDPYSSKGPSMERSYNKYDGRGSRSGSQHRSNDSSGSSSQRSTPAPMPQMTRPAPPPVPQQPAAPPQSAAPTVSVVLTEDQMERRIGNSLDEYVSGNCSVDEYYLEISSSIPASFYPRMVSICYMRVLEKSQHTRLKTGGLFAKLVKQEKISVDDYCIGLEDILSQGDDLVIDVPKIWDYIAEILVDLICDEALHLDRLKQSLGTLTQKNASKILGPLFKLVVEKNGAVFLQSIWKKSGVQLADFVDSADINKFTADYKLEFLVGGGAPVEQNLSYSHIEVKLLELFKFKSDLDTVVQWITTNIGDNIKNNNKFVRTLATAIFQDSIDSNYKLANDRLRERNKLFMLYVDNRPEYELQCLHALQALINKMEHPQGLLLSICNMLYELGTISQDCFIAWENCSDPAEQEGKGVAIKQLTSFFTQLKENEYDESDESDVA